MKKKKMNKELKTIKDLFKTLLTSIKTLIVGIFKIIYILIYNINNCFAKLFMKLPRILKISIVYSLIILILISYTRQPKIIEKEVVKEQISYVEINNNNNEITEEELVELEQVEMEEKQEEKFTCKYDNEYDCLISEIAYKKNLDDNQTKILIAISRWETGHYKSEVFNNKNNFGGNMSKGKFMSFESKYAGAEFYVNNLNEYYFKQGLTTLEKIQPKYCPIEGDTTGLNKNWLNGVTSLYNNL